MPTERKEKQVVALKDKVARCTIAISTEFRGLPMPQMNELRRKLREQGAEYVVVKNTLAAIAADQAGKPGLRQVLKGPTAIAFGYNSDVVAPARALAEHIQATKAPVTITGAVMDGQVLDAAGVRHLATLPPRPMLMAKLMGAMIGPLYGLSYVLSYHTGALARVLDARRKQLESAGGAPAAPIAAPAQS